MTLRLVIEHAAHPQKRPEMAHPGGDLSIGRGADCDWQIDDPDMYVSRRHCIVSERDGRYEVTDASRGGLFIDGSDTPLGAGNSAALEGGMRIRLGDVVIRADLETAPAATRPSQPAATGTGLDADDFFARRDAPAPAPPPRPDSLPEPFERGRPEKAAGTAKRPEAPPSFDDPFTLDPVPAAERAEARTAPDAGADDLRFDDFFGAPAEPRPEPTPPPQPVRRTEPPPARQEVQPAADHAPATDSALHAAFFRGLDLDPSNLPTQATEEEMEALGHRFRLLVDGLVAMLRTRAKEKGSVRVAQTVIGNADVNPLKFLATTDDALAALIAPRGRGYLPPDEAIEAAFRDLSDHQMRTWVGLQSALRRMIDRFDPAAFESEIESEGLVKTLLAGGRNAKLWQVYAERYREIAKAAEDRFLGEVGADFRDAYEGKGRTRDD